MPVKRAPFAKSRSGRPRDSRSLWRAGLASPPRRWLDYRACCVGPVICESRQAAEVSAEELANRLGVSVYTVYSWERGRAAPPLRMIVGIAAVLGTRVVDLVAGCEP
jgi:DNA-binding XRE family transcriptional regulator